MAGGPKRDTGLSQSSQFSCCLANLNLVPVHLLLCNGFLARGESTTFPALPLTSATGEGFTDDAKTARLARMSGNHPVMQRVCDANRGDAGGWEMKGCMRTGWLGRELLVAACLAIFLARPAVGELQLGSDFEPSESVEQISVRITVSSEGEDLQEPVALDLGLGFPFWLHPLGREEGEPVFFGALPNRTDALHTARAGSTSS